MKKQSGFTLIELMVVMAIIAILATAGLTAYSNYLKKARDSTRLSTARQIMTAVEGLANGGQLPTASALRAFLIEDGFAPGKPYGAYRSDEELDIDPLNGAATCLGNANVLWPASILVTSTTAHCMFSYLRFSDGTYAIGYSVEHPDNVTNFWYLDNEAFSLPGPVMMFGNFIGTNSYIVDTNSAGAGNDPLNINRYILDNHNSVVSVVDGDIISYINSNLGT